MYKKIIIITIAILGFQLSHAQTKIFLENYFRALKTVKVEIEGETYNFLFDTGGGLTMISPEIVKRINKTAYGNSVGFRMNSEKVESKLCDSLCIKIGGINFFHPSVGVFDMMGLLPKDFKRIDGLISLKTFEQERITLLLDENLLIVETEESYKEKIKNMTLLNCRFASGPNGSETDIFLGIRKNQHLWWFLFDSGNISQAKISEIVAREWGLSYQENEITEIGNYQFVIAGDSITTPAVIDNIIYDGALSFDFIQQSEYVISLKDEKIWKNSSQH